MSYKPEVFVEHKWSQNGLVFATREEAEQSASDLMYRWYAVTDSRAVESDLPVNYSYAGRVLSPVVAPGAITASGYVIADSQGNAIHGVGASVDEAWAQVVDEGGPWEDLDGNPRDTDEVFANDFEVHPASAALIAEVADRGGAISWSYVGSVACTEAEAATHENR